MRGLLVFLILCGGWQHALASVVNLPAAGDMTFTVSTTERMRIDANTGYVGIATSTPTASLTVVGTVSATYFVGDGSGLTNITTGSSGLPICSEEQTVIFSGGVWVCANSVSGDATYETPGTYTFTVPEGRTRLHAVVVGGGGGGANDTSGSNESGGGGGGGALRWRNYISVTPGESLTVIVGAGGAGSNNATAGSGGVSRIRRGSTDLLWAGGGAGGRHNNGAGGAGSTAGSVIGGNVGGGNGGNGGGGRLHVPGGGGGGAGGYTGDGGQGQTINVSNWTSGAGGGGAGGANNFNSSQGGGGVGLYGQGPSGASAGAGGSGGQSSGSLASGGQPGGVFGGGGSGPDDDAGGNGQAGGHGGVRIIWGPARSFPDSAGQF